MNTTLYIATTIVAIAAVSFGVCQRPPSNHGGNTGQPTERFSVVATERYKLEVPEGWAVGKETPWGARDITPAKGAGKIGAMTAGPSQADWSDLYRTSLYFIKREEPGKETPFRLGKTKQGYECIDFEVVNASGFSSRRYTLLKDGRGNVLALSIKIPSPDQEARFVAIFRHMVDSARLLPSS